MSNRPIRRPPEGRARAHFDYTTVGHVTVDVLEDGSRHAGGGAFYSALQAARLDQRTRIITRGDRQEIERLLDPHRAELPLELEVQPAAHTTTLDTTGQGSARRQRLTAWAEPITDEVRVDTSILHLAPVARETAGGWTGRAGFVGLTPQGLMRTWAGSGGEIEPAPLLPQDLPKRCDAIVLSEVELESCAWLISPTASERASDTIVVVTAEATATTLYGLPGSVARVDVPAIERVVDDLGAGDVFAAAFFIELAAGASPEAAAAFANAAAAVRISGHGADAVGDRRAIEARLGGRDH